MLPPYNGIVTGIEVIITLGGLEGCCYGIGGLKVEIEKGHLGLDSIATGSGIDGGQSRKAVPVMDISRRLEDIQHGGKDVSLLAIEFHQVVRPQTAEGKTGGGHKIMVYQDPGVPGLLTCEDGLRGLEIEG